jgi:hypothetical protein
MECKNSNLLSDTAGFMLKQMSRLRSTGRTRLWRGLWRGVITCLFFITKQTKAFFEILVYT